MTNEQVSEYSNLIYAISKMFSGYSSKEDLYQAGYIGLLDAFRHYDSTYETKFSTYAYPYIYGEMNKLVKNDKSIRISSKIQKLKNLIERKSSLLEQKLMRKPTDSELSEFINIDIELIKKCNQYSYQIQSFDEIICNDGKEINLYDKVGSKEMDMTLLLAFREELTNLNSEEKELFEKRFLSKMTQSEVAKEMNMTQVQISRKEQKIKEKIKSKVA